MTTGRKGKLTYFEFIFTIFLLTSAGPFGFEYVVIGIGVGYTLILITLFAIFYCFPIALLSSELSGLMPSNHGQIVWAYRAFNKIHPLFGDFIGYINAVNSAIFWTLETAAIPLVLVSYLETVTGPIGFWVSYGIQLCVIISGFILNLFEFSIIAHITTFFCIAVCIPFLIGFFWTLPDINPSTQWMDACPNIDWGLAITTAVWEFCGFEALGNLVGELAFDTKYLASAYILGIISDILMLYIPVISSATRAHNECEDWFDGFFAVSYDQLSIALSYSILVGSTVINWCIYITAIGVASRMVWAMSQPYFEILSDGRMVVSEGTNDLGGHTQIAINILPKKWTGQLSSKGAPIGATICLTVLIAISNLIFTFDQLVEFNLFSYFIFFVCSLLSYLILKHTEPNTPRPFTIPCGLYGAWTVVCVLVIALGICFGVLVADSYKLVGYSLLMNLLLIVYYFVAKKWFNRMHQPNIITKTDLESFQRIDTDDENDDSEEVIETPLITQFDDDDAELEPLI